MTLDIDRRDVQGNILRGYNFAHCAHLFFVVEEGAAEAAKSALGSLEITSDDEWPMEGERRLAPDVAVNVAFTHAGLATLGGALGASADFPAFAEGMAPRASLLGDDECEPFWSAVHVWISLHGGERIVLERSEAITRALAPHLRRVAEPLLGHSRDPAGVRREHFGFRDALSNPWFDGMPGKGDRGTGKIDSNGNVVPIATGELLLGYQNETGETRHEAVLRNGTFVVFRQLEQNVPAFRAYVEESAARHELPAPLVAAKIVGRHQDGRPLIPSGKGNNDFAYATDPDGSKCPFGSHVRRAHPRDPTGLSQIAASHRILRRGMPYGPWLGDDETDEARRGLLFIAMNASIERQFEFIQRFWINGSSASGLPDDRDPVTGSHVATEMMIQGDAPSGRMPVLLTNLPRFVECRGGQYFFMPGMRALARLLEPRRPAHLRSVGARP